MSTTDREHIIEMIHRLQARADKLHKTLEALPGAGCLKAETDAFILYEDLLRLESDILENS